LADPPTSIDVVLEEYRQMWSYYHRTLDERKNLLDWYFKTVELPAVAVGFSVAKDTGALALPNNVGGTILSVVFLIGVTIHGTYAKESANAAKYQTSMKAIRAFVKLKYPELCTAIVIDEQRETKSGGHRLGSIRAWRGFMIGFANAAIGTASLVLLFGWDSWCLQAVWFVLLAAAHLALYNNLYKSYEGD